MQADTFGRRCREAIGNSFRTHRLSWSIALAAAGFAAGSTTWFRALRQSPLLVLTGIGLILVIAVIAIPAIQANRLPGLDAEKRAAMENEFRKTVAQAATAVLIAVGFVFTSQQITAASQKDIGDRFSKAVDQLGNTSAGVRIGGIYSLSRILHDAPSEWDTIAQVLAAFVRQNAADATSPIPSADVLAALRVLGAGTLPQPGIPIDLRKTYFQAVPLARLALPGASLIQAHFDDADLSGADLRGARLGEASLRGAILRGAKLQGADLQGSFLVNADLAGADLRGVEHADIDQLRRARWADAILPPDMAAALRAAELRAGTRTGGAQNARP